MRTHGRQVILTVLLLLYSVPGWSLGLGDARVQSFIGQPLEMRIDLLVAPNDDLGSVSARLASAEDFALIGASRTAISVPLQFMIREGRDDSGNHILVTSRLPVNNPVLRLVVEVNWSSGRLLREYTVFLDPPTVAAQAPDPQIDPAASSAQVASESAQSQARPVPEFTDRPPPPPPVGRQSDTAAEVAQERVPEPPAREPREQADPVAADDETADESFADTGDRSPVYGPVQSGETLWRIATNFVGQSQMDMNQVMVAIQRKNPNAFVNQNINLLKRGATLDMPSEGEVIDVSPAEARAMVAQHEAAFRMRSSLASTSTPLLASESQSRSVSGSPSAQDNAPPDSANAPVDDAIDVSTEETVALLEIVPATDEDMAAAEPGTGAVPGGEGSDEVSRDIREELARTEEALISAQQENTYLQERIAELETQLAETADDSEGTVADAELSDLENRLESERLAQQEATAAEEDSTPVPSVTTLSDQEKKPWYSGSMIWIIMVIIVVAAIIGWLFNRRRGAIEYDLDAGGASVPSRLKDEAEEILRTLDEDKRPDIDSKNEFHGGERYDEVRFSEKEPESTGEPEAVVDIDDPEEVSKEEASDSDVVPLASARRRNRDDTADATVLSEDSSDPEIKLDLARAYISMGDKEAARAILDEVLNVGNEQQRTEARSMMDEI